MENGTPMLPLEPVLEWSNRYCGLMSAGTVTEATVNYDGGDGGASTARSRDKSVIFDDAIHPFSPLGFRYPEYTRPLLHVLN